MNHISSISSIGDLLMVIKFSRVLHIVLRKKGRERKWLGVEFTRSEGSPGARIPNVDYWTRFVKG